MIKRERKKIKEWIKEEKEFYIEMGEDLCIGVLIDLEIFLESINKKKEQK